MPRRGHDARRDRGTPGDLAAAVGILGALGNTTTTITGNEALYGALSGFANTANRMAAFYERQLESLVPAVYVPNGLTGSAVIQGGVTLDGVGIEHLLAQTGGAPWRGLD